MNVQDYLNQFATPDPHFSPVPLWWWSGEPLEIGRLCWQLDQLSAMGIHNVVVINLAPSGTLFGSEPDDPPFLSEAWWGIFEQVCDHARAIGTSIWFYDQIGFSGANYQSQIVSAHRECLGWQIKRAIAEGVGSLRLECPVSGTPIAAYVMSRDSSEPPRYVPVDDRIAMFEATTPSRLNLVYTVRQGYDLFSREACERLLEAVHRQFERRLPQHLGSTIVGSFQDELPDLPSWGDTFAETFATKHGYDLTQVVHRLFEEGDIESRRTRVHYHAHRAELSEEAFFKPFFQWHEARGLRCGYDQQSPAREARAIGCTAKYADYIQTQRWYAIPGSDLHGNGKLHASIAWMYGRERVWIEGFHSTGWGGTLADTFDWLMPYLRSGANLYNPHAVYYSTRKGWWEWAPPSTCWRQPYAMHYRPFAEMIARLTKLLSRGTQQATVGVLFPTTTVQSALSPEDHFPEAEAADRTLHEVIGSMRWHQAKLGGLDELAIDFHLLDEPSIQNAELIDDAMAIRGVKLQTIVLPAVTMLHDETREKLTAFVATGGKVVAVDSGESETVSGATRIANASELATVLNDAPRLLDAPVPTLYRRDGDMHVLFVPAVAGMATEVKWPGWFAPMEHTTMVPERLRKSVDLTLPQSAKKVWRCDPWTGGAEPLVTEAVATGRRLALDFDRAPFAVLVWSDRDKDGVAQVSSKQVEQIEVPLTGDWRCEYLPTLPTEYGDIFDPSRPELRWPHTTDFKSVVGEGDKSWSRGLPGSTQAETIRAGFGVRAWRIDGSGQRRPIEYSPAFGIRQDRTHINTLGPKGHVLEEFIDLGKLKAGEQVAIQTGVVSADVMDVGLAVGANAAKLARLNGETLAGAGSEYLWTTPARLTSGVNDLEIVLTADRDGMVRLFWCFLKPEGLDVFRRPERIVAAGVANAGSSLSYRRRFDVKTPAHKAEVKISVAAMAEVFLDDQSLGRIGGFDPYRPMLRGEVFQIAPLSIGAHQIRIDPLEPPTRAPLVVDLRATTESGETLRLMSDASWTVSRDGADVQPVQIEKKQEADAAAWQLYRRPHALPQTRWLDGGASANNDVVLDLPLVPPSVEPMTQWFEWSIPPGAESMRLPLVEDAAAQLWIDGNATAIDDADNVHLSGGDDRPKRLSIVRVQSRQIGGGVFSDLVSYRFSTGTIKTGSWLVEGLRSYSGAIVMRRTIDGSAWTNHRAILDLGQVRGTVEARINGRSAGVRVMSPYRFDLTGLTVPGPNDLELIVTNTLANHLSTWSPTTWWSPDQLDAGVFGPVVVSLAR